MTASFSLKKKLLIVAAAAVVIALAWWGWTELADSGPGEGFVNGNGRIEATEIDIATKLPGRIEDILVREGDFVVAGQPLARMQLETLEAQRDEAFAMREQAEHAVTAAQAQVALREADVVAAQALVGQRESELDAAQRRLARSETLSREGAASIQELDDDRARVRGAQATLAASKAQTAAARAAVEAAKAHLVGARSSVSAATASINRIEADIRDSELRAPRDGRVQIRVAQPGEVLGAGGRVLNLIDLSDVYITFFLPETVAGRVALGTEVRIILDAAPDFVIPATVSFVASVAQFTPKTVETASERQKLMFRVRGQISQDLLREHLDQVKTGLPGVAWVKLDANAEWPENLSLRVPE
ncbi:MULTISPECIES: HlyD family secretion protein [unclassified Marinobacterium]|uniref:HlyD family secretion protein n=1 Tax=unclassified Marinobacterium TaxID=2644139 RepID=UPI0015698B54|nr:MULTISPECIES: efflux RND transporter periplasmic adaptor subunit [unclassified Marinobacterium]NRP28157.1 Multidrug resistance protein MdtN [Marinobacterium sp. xm-d-420]NRP38087.1 Multidrug resistance protein MdtN [Marinobacterium sp. xm-a-121]NRP48139.1 Multidrug resistance protein MdtN [Marinobacterium sp. xm-d-543]NRP57640.1 Multidrug resistance protein MdtN [Marinobacterium sp. xm-d-510]NRP98152.1 Multidrug resistance protein MdtN [Marinobacterium sp. xm-a-127]